MTAKEYIDAIATALTYAREHYCPFDLEERRKRLLMLARDIGYGLSPYSDGDVQKVITATYSRIVVRNTLDSVGVPFTNSEWIRAIYKAIDAARKAQRREGVA